MGKEKKFDSHDEGWFPKASTKATRERERERAQNSMKTVIGIDFPLTRVIPVNSS